MDLYQLFARFGLGALVATAAIGCAQERDTINRVDAYALSKKFFVGPKMNDATDDPEFYASTTVIDVPYGVQAGVFGGLVGDLRRIKWEITQDLLNARLTYENVQDSDGNGNRTTNSGQIVASFKIDSHFDIKREYNPQTGEELNVIGENTSDRPWHAREYFRVDWSSNLLESALNFDPLALDKMTGQELEKISYRVEPNDVDAPVFSPTEGYFDITNKVYIKPLTIDGFPSCWYYAAFTVGATGPFGACEPSEVKLRLSFRRVPQRGDANFRDYEPKEWDGARFNANGAFYHERVGYDKGYGVVDAKWHHLLQRYNIWDKSHTDIACSAQGDIDNGGDGTDDQCATAGAGSRCDDLSGLCTIPFAKRITRPNAWHYNVNGEDEVIFDSTNLATEEWDTAMRIAVQAARRVECVRTKKASLDGTPWAGMECGQAFPIVQTDDAEVESVRAVNRCWKTNGYKADACKPADPNSVAALDPIIALCHNPVRKDDDPMCGAEGLVTRVGDLRYHQVNVFPKPQAISTPWGYGPTLADPLTGEVISAGINVWNYVTDLQAQTVVDQIRYMNGELQASDITSSPYVDGSLYSRASSAHYPGSSPLMTRAEIDQRVLGTGAMTPEQLAQAPGLRKDLDIRKMTQTLVARSAEAAVGFAAQSSAAPGGAARTQSEARIALAKGTPIEAELMGQAWMDMAPGLDTKKASHEEILNRASPLRGLDGHTIAGLEQHVQAELARKGQCMMSAPEPTGLVPLAKIMKDKFPYVAGAPQQAQSDRITKMTDYLRAKLNYAVIAHEMGHTVGMRHNFASSWDRFNYRPQYWQLRTRGGTVTEACTGPVADGATCVGPRYYDPLDQDEQDQMIWMWSQTTVMDYAGDITQDMLGLGVYDYAAARAFYSDVVDVRNDGITVPPPGTPTAALTPEQMVGDQMFDMIDGASFPLAQAFVNDGTEFLHYSKWNNFFHMLNKDTCKQVDTNEPPGWNTEKYGKYSAVFDGHIVRGERCERMPVDYVDWRDMVPDTTRVQLTNYNPLWILARRAVDNKGRPRMPYAFCTDNWVESGSSSCYQHDNGADIFEEMMFHDRLYEDRHVFDNFRRGKSSFSLYGAYQRSVARYHNKIETLAGYVSFLHDNILHDIANKEGVSYSTETARYESEGAPLRDYILAASFGFDHFTRSISRPQPGPHFLNLAQGMLRPFDDGSPGSNGDVLDMPQGSAGMGNDVSYGGRPIQNGFVASNGYYVVNSLGSYYDKTHAMLAMLNQGVGHGNWNREQGVDGRLYTANLTGLYPEGARRLLGSLLTEDQALYAPRVATRQSGFPSVSPIGVYKYPSRPVGWVTFTTPGGPATCWPMNGSESCADTQGTPLPGMPATAPATSIAIDPELGFEVQKFILFYSYVFLPASQRNDWLDMLRLYKLGGDVDPAFDASTLVEWQDPQSGFHYLAKRFGDEQIMGKTYDKGIAAKMLQWANTLASSAYEPADPMVPFDPKTGRFLYKTDARGVPVVKKDPVIPPDDAANVRCDENLACLQLRNYRGLLDFSRDIGTMVGFGVPCLNGVSRPGIYCE